MVNKDIEEAINASNALIEELDCEPINLDRINSNIELISDVTSRFSLQKEDFNLDQLIYLEKTYNRIYRKLSCKSKKTKVNGIKKAEIKMKRASQDVETLRASLGEAVRVEGKRASADTSLGIDYRRVPIYDPKNQLRIKGNEKKGNYGDAVLYAVAVERTRYMREVQRMYHFPFRSAGGMGLEWAMENTDKGVGRKFQAHGIAGKRDPVMELDELLTGGIKSDRPLYSMPFAVEEEFGGAFGALHPFTQGGIVVVSEYGRRLLKDGIKYVILGEEYNRVLGLLQSKYPDVKFVPWNLAPKVLTEETNRITGQKRDFVEVNENNRPVYPDPKRGLLPDDTESTPDNTMVDLPGHSPGSVGEDVF
jgi:hypothetical protein